MKINGLNWFLVIGLLMSCSSKEHNLFGSIKGEVRKEQSGGIIVNPPPLLSGVEVLLSLDANVLQRVITKTDGKYKFINLDAGNYLISVQKKGYDDQHIAVSVMSGEEANISILMTKETNL